jgi:hypothetical protein
MILQLDPPICLHTPKGKGFAHFLIDYGIETHLFYVVFLNETGECWTFANPEIRIENNPTIGRYVTNVKPLYNQQALNPEVPSDSLPPPESENEWKYNYTKKSGLSEQ